MTTKNIINLNVKSNYTLLQSCLSIDAIINNALANQWDCVCLVDVNVMYGALEFYYKALQNNLKPIIGLEVTIQEKKYIFVALNYDGYLELVKISSDVMTNQELIFENLKIDNCATICVNFQPDFDIKNLYTSLPGLNNTIAIKDSRYENNVTSYIEYKTLQYIESGNDDFNIAEIEASFNVLNSIATNEDSIFMHKYENTCGFENLDKLINQINWTIPKNQNHMVKFSNDKSFDSVKAIKEKCAEFLAQYLQKNPNLDEKTYIERLNYELDVIIDKNFVDYFLVVADFIEYARKNQILIGPGRGSSAGSLTAFCLQITKIDPIKYNLIFERFLNPSRSNMPDIDTDVMDKSRDVIVNYLFEKYGAKNVGLISTFQTFKAKMAFRDVAKIFKVSSTLIQRISKTLDMNADESIIDFIMQNEETQKEYKAEKTLFNVANSLLNIPRQVSTHAAGVILSDIPLDQVCPITIGINNHYASQYSWNYLEDIGLIKMDILGLKNLSIIDDILKIINFTNKTKFTLDDIDLDDKQTYELIAKGETNGVFQLESPGMKSLCIKMKPKNIEDISMINALFRPGPMNHINEFINVRNHERKPQYINDAMIPVLASTNGIILYQEQVIQLATLVAGFSPAKADIFRKAISKKDEQKMEQLKQEFIDGSIKNGYSEKDAHTIYDYIFDFANYGFNHSHSVAYSIISYWMAYLKCHYPIPFFVSLLTNGGITKDKMASYIEEIKERGIQLLGPNINLSNNYYSITKNGIVFSFTSIKGIGVENSNKIIEIRNSLPNKKFEDPFRAIVQLANGGINVKVIKALIEVGAFDTLGVNRNTLFNSLDGVLNILRYDQYWVPVYLPEWSEKEKMLKEQQLLSITLTSYNDATLFQKYKTEYNLVKLDEVNSQGGNVIGTLNNVAIKTSQKTKKNFANVTWTIDGKKINTFVFSGSLINSLNNLVVDQNYIICISKNEKNNLFDLKKIVEKDI